MGGDMVLEDDQNNVNGSNPGIALQKRASKGTVPESRDLVRSDEDRKNIDEIMDSPGRLREISARLLNAQEEERSRIAHEVHENLAQAFVAIQFRVETALSKMKGDGNAKLVELLGPVTSILQEGIDSVRRLAGRLRPLILDDLGVLVTISRLCRETSAGNPEIYIREQWEVEEGDIPGVLKLVIYRILESVMSNILKRKKAGIVAVGLERKDGSITLTVEDNLEGPDQGLIFSGDEIFGWSGSATIGERTMLSGGSATIFSQERGGTVLRVEWPVERNECPRPNVQFPLSKE
ncbi:MAG: hypothetical protein C4576_05725 [Desulfobacteraceae bacterium]|nr:MAG: hypothetical protein C4576_05725 [Desulfobacteraceae bacterium]